VNTVLVTEREDGPIKAANTTSSLSSACAAPKREIRIKAGNKAFVFIPFNSGNLIYFIPNY
jgi:hypothetical protein